MQFRFALQRNVPVVVRMTKVYMMLQDPVSASMLTVQLQDVSGHSAARGCT